MKWLLLLIKYLPSVIAGVVAVEGAIKGAPGASKKQLVLDAIQAGAAVGEKVPEDHVAAISHMIDSVVTSLNSSGVFVKDPASPKTP